MKTRNTIIGLLAVSCVLAFAALPAHALPPLHIWSKGVGGASTDAVFGLVVDSNGNVFIGGTFQGTSNFGGANLVDAGGGDMFIAKYNSSGVHQWSKRFGLTQDDLILALALDASGNVYFGGKFTGSQSFGGAAVPYSALDDIMLVKFDTNGNHLWSKAFGSTSDENILGLAVDNAGNVIATGFFQGTVDFGGGGGGLTAAGTGDIFVIKYSSTGSYVWSKRLGAVNFEQGNALAVDASNNIIVTGQFMNQVDFGGGLISAHGAADRDLFIAKYNSSGVHQWSKGFGENTTSDEGKGVAVDASGNVYLTGTVEGPVNFGGGILPGLGLRDAILVKFDPAGTHVWSRRWGSASFEGGNGVAIDPSGNILLTGYFYSTINFGGDTFNASGNSDIFLAEFMPDATHLRSGGWGNVATQETGVAVAVDPSRRVVIAGNYNGVMSLGGASLAYLGLTDVFVAKYYVETRGPLITRIKDVGNDQGRVVNIEFQRANNDDTPQVPPTSAITRYEAYRRTTPTPAATTSGLDALSTGQLLASGWQYVGQVPAHGAFEYTMDAPTLADSTVENGMYRSAFYLRAASNDPLTYYDSPIDSGYSKDNLSPAAPENLIYTAGDLSWNESSAADFDYFTVYGSNMDAFGASVVVDYSAAPSMDVSGSPYAFYFVTATDVSGNEGKPARVAAPSGTFDAPKSYVLSVANFPNPFNPRTTVSYTVPSRGAVSISIYDVRGALVATLFNGDRSAGAYTIEWDGRSQTGTPVSTGVYLARIEHASGTRSKKMVLLK